MQKRIFGIIATLILLLIPSSLAYWNQASTPKNLVVSTGINVLFDFKAPGGVIDWEEETDHKFSKDNIVQVDDDDKYYHVINPEICVSYPNGQCPKPGGDNAYQNPYRALTIEWVPNQIYYKNNVVTYDNEVYIFVLEQSYSHKTPPPKNQEEWKLLSHIKYDMIHKRYANSYLQINSDSVVYLLQSGLWTNQTFPTWPYDNQVELKFSESYSALKNYSIINYSNKLINPVVFHNGAIYRSEDIKLANQHEPGSQYGAWNRIDSIDWTNYNVYKKDDIVTHNGYVYKASKDGIRTDPGKVSPQWILLMEVEFQENVIYKKGHVVLYKNKMYKAETDIIDGTFPGSDQSKWK